MGVRLDVDGLRGSAPTEPGDQTDSERVFGTIHRFDPRPGARSTGLIDALVAHGENVPICPACCSARDRVWALQYPGPTAAYLGPPRRASRSSTCEKQANPLSRRLRERSSVVFATEPMVDNPRWRLLDAGEAQLRGCRPAGQQESGAT